MFVVDDGNDGLLFSESQAESQTDPFHFRQKLDQKQV